MTFFFFNPLILAVYHFTICNFIRGTKTLFVSCFVSFFSFLFLYAIQSELQDFGDNSVHFLRVFLTAHFSTTKLQLIDTETRPLNKVLLWRK